MGSPFKKASSISWKLGSGSGRKYRVQAEGTEDTEMLLSELASGTPGEINHLAGGVGSRWGSSQPSSKLRLMGEDLCAKSLCHASCD